MHIIKLKHIMFKSFGSTWHLILAKRQFALFSSSFVESICFLNVRCSPCMKLNIYSLFDSVYFPFAYSKTHMFLYFFISWFWRELFLFIYYYLICSGLFDKILCLKIYVFIHLWWIYFRWLNWHHGKVMHVRVFSSIV